jgi:hypothetical protein
VAEGEAMMSMPSTMTIVVSEAMLDVSKDLSVRISASLTHIDS